MKPTGYLEEHYAELLRAAQIKIANLEKENSELRAKPKKQMAESPDTRDKDIRTLKKHLQKAKADLERYFFLIGNPDYRIYRYAGNGGYAIIDRNSRVIGQGKDTGTAIDSAMGKVTEDVEEY